jgi:hypothetical protein
MRINKTDNGYMITFYNDEDMMGYQVSNYFTSLFLTPSQLKELQSLEVEEEPTEQEKEEE